MKKTKEKREQWKRENIFYYINTFGQVCVDFADNKEMYHHQLADMNNFFWDRSDAEIIQKVYLKTLKEYGESHD